MECLPHVHTVAIHAEAGYHAVTPGIGVFCRENGLVLGTGIYANSEKHTPRLYSKYVFVGYQPIKITTIRLGGIVGVVNNYKQYNYGWGLLAAFVISKPMSFGEAHITYIPKTTYNTTTIQLSFSVRF